MFCRFLLCHFLILILLSSESADIAVWNSNGSTVDVFLKKSAIDNGAAEFLNKAAVRYSVVIENMQKEIDNENPPQDEIEQLQDRKGNSFSTEKYALE